jgi:hypothetical protein
MQDGVEHREHSREQRGEGYIENHAPWDGCLPVQPTSIPEKQLVSFPRVRLRNSSPEMLALPWEKPLADWSAPDICFRDLPVGPSRHLVRFIEMKDAVYAFKELPLRAARQEYNVLRHLEAVELAAVRPVGLVEATSRDVAILVTEYLQHSLQYRRLLARASVRGPYRDRLLDAMAWLLVDIHRNGVFWGDCSLANTLFRRDGPRIQAYLVDAETSEVHPSLSEGLRMHDLEILVENVAYGLADLAAAQKRHDDMEDAVYAAQSTRMCYLSLWNRLHSNPVVAAGDRHAMASHIRYFNEMGFAIDEVELAPSGSANRVQIKLAVSNRRFHAIELQRRTGIVALEGQARLLLNDLNEYRAWLEFYDKRHISPDEGTKRWKQEVLEPKLKHLTPAIGPHRDPLQAYCDLLEHKWLLSERAGKDVGLEAAMDSYLAMGAPAPEGTGEKGVTSDLLLDSHSFSDELAYEPEGGLSASGS